MKLTFAEMRGIMPTIRKLTPYGLTMAANVLTQTTGKVCDAVNLKHFCKQYAISVPSKEETTANMTALVKESVA